MPFFCKFFVKEKNILFVHQLCRRIWFYQMIFPLNLVGYILEPIYLRLLNDRKVITISKSTKTDLLKRGFKEEKVSIIVEGIETDPIDDVASIKKFENPTVLSFGAVRPMKRTDHIIKAFEIAKKHISGLELMIAGDTSGAFGEKVSKMAKDSKYSQSIRFLGKVTAVDKTTLMQKAHLFLVASVKEGWGLVVTEANSQGTPAVVYNVDGLRDAVKDNETGLICDENTPTGMAEKIVYLFEHQDLYRTVQKNGLAWSREINFEYSYKQFISKLGV